MEKRDVEELRDRVLCAAVLEQAGFAIDLKESTRRAVKYRRGDDIIIVIHDGKGWFDPLSDAKGDVFSLVAHLEDIGFAEVLQRVSELVGFVPSEPVWTRQPRDRAPDLGVPERWRVRRKPWRGSMTWRYLRDERDLPETVIRAAIRQDRLREGPRGSVWAAHVDDDGVVTGWEERGPEWRGFASGGAKVLFRLGPIDAIRLCVTEAAIDAISLAAIDDLRFDSLYLSTGGGWAPATEAAIRVLAARPNVQLVAATDNNSQGEVYARRIEAIAVAATCGYERLAPVREDWNEELRASRGRERDRREEKETRLPHARRPRQG
ncbi:DUF3991 domain-containing protein [Mesorhizobium sp. M1A.T.Ca.IN.004.03.1.1]|uniref:DUF3991 and toprim domain-containing protein n=1 Tax=Mesorhizobium sp. M1A.T.Ca.IN.004.03.1.1 TaxID=2496795 RepID=UPI000FCA8ADC|nr:DUF3991 and toprim domain-containing protein [Mesorhizobium sp. M1A.T.Ca.IN.004.03.1.1]RUV41172.1 DUF3991 domain-containing protein [Mesorhizobium sp. M1A.T.Ca.IN.004.03.1.1]